MFKLRVGFDSSLDLLRIDFRGIYKGCFSKDLISNGAEGEISKGLNDFSKLLISLALNFAYRCKS